MMQAPAATQAAPTPAPWLATCQVRFKSMWHKVGSEVDSMRQAAPATASKPATCQVLRKPMGGMMYRDRGHTSGSS